jgi:flagellar hook-associated protein 2
MATSAVSSSTASTSATSSAGTTASNGAAVAAKIPMTDAQIQAANHANAQKIITALGTGSGVDVNSLAQNLVDAEKTPQTNAINAKIGKNDAKVSGFSAVSYVLSNLNTAFTALKSRTALDSVTATSTDNTAFTITSGTNSKYAPVGTHNIVVNSVAKAQQNISNRFGSGSDSINGGAAMSVSVTIGAKPSSTIQLPAGMDTPQDMVDAINNSNTGVTAQLVDTGDGSATPFAIVFSGPTGAANKFSVSLGSSTGSLAGNTLTSNSFSNASSSLNSGLSMNLSIGAAGGAPLSVAVAAGQDTPQGLVSAINSDPNATAAGFSATLINRNDGSASPYQIVLSGPNGNTSVVSMNATDVASGNAVGALTMNGGMTVVSTQAASNAELTMDGISYKRASNSITDVLPGLTLNLQLPSTSMATVTVARDTSAITNNVNTLVSAYNDAMSMINVVTDPKSTVTTYGATLVGDSTVRMIKQQLRSMITSTTSAFGANPNSVTALWQLGISIDQTGVMSVDSTKLNSALSTNFSDVVTALTNNSENSFNLPGAKAGIAGDASATITDWLSSTGLIKRQTDNANTQNTKYQTDLDALNTRMDALLKRYQTQFAAMDSLVGSVNSQKTSLKSSFDGMMAMYTNK